LCEPGDAGRLAVDAEVEAGAGADGLEGEPGVERQRRLDHSQREDPAGLQLFDLDHRLRGGRAISVSIVKSIIASPFSMLRAV
jgi:hypothetical protein